MKLDQIHAGSEVDALITEKVMGRSICQHSRVRGVAQSGGFAMCSVHECKGELHYNFLPHYSTDIGEAWKVLDHIVRETKVPKSRFFRLERSQDSDGAVYYTVLLSGLDTPSGWEVLGRCATAPLAVCAAALKYAEQK